ncbi:MAG: hypothetical protein ACPGGD_08435, partial [Thalassolituus sp.]
VTCVFVVRRVSCVCVSLKGLVYWVGLYAATIVILWQYMTALWANVVVNFVAEPHPIAAFGVLL